SVHDLVSARGRVAGQFLSAEGVFIEVDCRGCVADDQVGGEARTVTHDRSPLRIWVGKCAGPAAAATHACRSTHWRKPAAGRPGVAGVPDGLAPRVYHRVAQWIVKE